MDAVDAAKPGGMCSWLALEQGNSRGDAMPLAIPSIEESLDFDAHLVTRATVSFYGNLFTV